MQTVNRDSVNTDVERMLDGMQAARDWRELREMNGKTCGGKQVSMLRRYQANSIPLNQKSAEARQ